MSRERFEKLFPVPEWAEFINGEGYTISLQGIDPATGLERMDRLRVINAGWIAYQSRQLEIDELLGVLGWIASDETACDCFDGADEIEKIKERATSALAAYRIQEGK